jgi:hypothetical protein
MCTTLTFGIVLKVYEDVAVTFLLRQGCLLSLLRGLLPRQISQDGMERNHPCPALGTNSVEALLTPNVPAWAGHCQVQHHIPFHNPTRTTPLPRHHKSWVLRKSVYSRVSIPHSRKEAASQSSVHQYLLIQCRHQRPSLKTVLRTLNNCRMRLRRLELT